MWRTRLPGVNDNDGLKKAEHMSAFWIVGIVLNLALPGLILYWLIKQGKPKAPDAQAARTPPPATGDQDAD